MRTLPALAMAILLACIAGCGDRTPPSPTTDTSTDSPADAARPADDEGVVRRFDCQADTTVAVLDSGDARVSLPGGQRHVLSPVAGSDPQVYTGDTLYFTIDAGPADTAAPGESSAGAGTAHLSQQDGARELACTEAG